MAASWTALILAGGRAQRLGNVEKATLRLGEQTLLDAVIAGLPVDVPVVVAGPRVPVAREVRFCLEEPRFGGPVAGIAAALPLVSTPLVALLATDMPGAGALAARLVAELDDEAEALVPVDPDGRAQPLCSVLRTAALRRAVDALGPPAGASLRSLLGRLAVHERPLLAGEADAVLDVDTPEDLVRMSQVVREISD